MRIFDIFYSFLIANLFSFLIGGFVGESIAYIKKRDLFLILTGYTIIIILVSMLQTLWYKER